MSKTNRCTIFHVRAIVAALALASSAAAQDDATETRGILPIPDYGGDVWTRPYLTGDWGGTRASLADKGVQIGVDFAQVLQSIVSGGTKRTTEYGGLLDYLVNLDLYRMGVVPGALVKIRAQTRYGESVNNFAGMIVPVNTDGFFPLSADAVPFAITDLAWYQFLSEEFGVFAGKIDTLNGDPNPFASGRGNTQFLNSAFVFPTIAALCVPYSTLAVGVLVEPCPAVSISSTFMNTADASTTSGFDGFGDGWTWSTEADFQYALGGLPGGQNVGLIIAGDRDYFQFGGRFVFQPGLGLVPPTSDNTWAVYWSGWQYLHTEDDVKSPIDLENGPPGVQGFGVFARAGIGDNTTNPIEWNISAGVGGQGVIPGRDDDMFGIGYYYSGLQTTLLTPLAGVHNNAQAFEAFYSFAITPAAQLTLDLQVVRGPPPGVDPALVLGMRLFLNF